MGGERERTSLCCGGKSSWDVFYNEVVGLDVMIRDKLLDKLTLWLA